MWNDVEEFYILNVYLGYPFFSRRTYFIIKIDITYYRLLFSPNINIKKLITTSIIKHLLVGEDRYKIYLFSRFSGEEDKELNIEEIRPFIKLTNTTELRCKLRKWILKG